MQEFVFSIPNEMQEMIFAHGLVVSRSCLLMGSTIYLLFVQSTVISKTVPTLPCLGLKQPLNHPTSLRQHLSLPVKVPPNSYKVITD